MYQNPKVSAAPWYDIYYSQHARKATAPVSEQSLTTYNGNMANKPGQFILLKIIFTKTHLHHKIGVYSSI